MADDARDLPKLFSDVVADGERAYRAAIAAEVEGKDPNDLWDEWQADTAALLLVSWVSGAATTLRTAGVPMKHSRPRSRFDRIVDIVEVAFEPGPAREVVKRYATLVPLTRQRWDSLLEQAFAAAEELRQDEQANGLAMILDRSPDVAALVTGRPPEPEPREAPRDVRVRRTPEVQRVAQSGFFVTGMTKAQIKETQALLGKAIRGEVTTSAAGKRLEELGVGDFVEQTIIETGTDLTKARLETVYRTNLNRAQTQGRLDIVRDKTVKRFVPLMQLRATKDVRTRDTHSKFSGYLATVEQIDEQGIPAPLGFNCRCSWVPVSLAKAVAAGWCDEDGKPNVEAIRAHNGGRQDLVDRGLIPDPGFISG
jgi:SPP1 gp7 family putative phage head morphogenesis protein